MRDNIVDRRINELVKLLGVVKDQDEVRYCIFVLDDLLERLRKEDYERRYCG